MQFQDVLRTVVQRTQNVYEQLKGHGDNFDFIGIGADGTPTTLIDQMLENAVIQSLQDIRIGGSVLSEEAGRVQLEGPENDLVFVVDPLDGTSNAEMNFPYFALSIGVIRGEQTLASVLYQYCTRDLFYAEAGKGAFLNNTLIRVNQETNPQKGRLVLSRPFNDIEAEMYKNCILRTKRVRMTGCPSLDVATVASGTFMAYIDFHVPLGLVKTHDLIAAQLLLQEAGGDLLNEEGESLVLSLDVTTTYNIFAVNCVDTFRNTIGFFTQQQTE